jgi:hypothetical protein
MLSWGTIAYGAALSAVLGVLLALVARERRPLVLVAVAVGAGGGPVAWNAQFFVDAPIPAFPISWQDTGSGVFAFAALALILAAAVPSTSSPRRVAGLALLGSISALLVDIYLY